MNQEPSYTEKHEQEKRIALAKHVFENTDNLAAKSFATGILNLRSTSKVLYNELRDIIDSEDLYEELEICRECGEWPEYGACNYCKMD